MKFSTVINKLAFKEEEKNNVILYIITMIAGFFKRFQ
jgi:hypothetical protein